MNDFLNSHKDEIQSIIDELGVTFDSHDFIRPFAKRFEHDYVQFLYASSQTKNEGIFREIHAAIGKHLSFNSADYNIRSIGRKPSANVFGYESEVEVWEKIKK